MKKNDTAVSFMDTFNMFPGPLDSRLLIFGRHIKFLNSRYYLYYIIRNS